MDKPQEQTDTQIIIPFVQMTIPFSHPRNGAKLKYAYVWVRESRYLIPVSNTDEFQQQTIQVMIRTQGLCFTGMFNMFFFYDGFMEMRIL